MKRLLLLALLVASPLLAADRPGLRYPTDRRSLVSNGTTAGTCEDGATSVAVATTTAGTVGIDVGGTWTGTLQFWTKTGEANGYKAQVNATPVGGGTAVASTTSNGQWTIAVAGNSAVCVAFTTSAATGTAVVQLNSSPGAPPSGSSGGSGSGGPPASSTRGAQIACNGGSGPCLVSAALSDVLNANPSRKSCRLTNRYTTTLYCKLTTMAASAASSTAYDFELFPATTFGAEGGYWSCDSNGSVWQGPVNCVGSGGTTGNLNLEIYETQ